MNYIKDEEIKNDVLKVHDYVINTRRYLHIHPELGLQENNTCAFIRSELDKMSIPWIEASPTGTIGIIEGNDSDNILALRADIDALKIKEEADVEFKSEVDGLMHACGHDAHTATLLAAAKILKEKYEHKFAGKIYLIFQPGEETALGAKGVVKSGAVDKVKTFYGQHIWTPLQTGKFMYRANSFMAGARIFNIDVSGISGHGSMLEKTANPIVAASNIVMALQTIVSDNVSSFDSAVVCVGGINGGGQSNAVPSTCHIVGTTRFTSKAMDESLCKRIEEIADYASKTYSCSAKVQYPAFISALCTDEQLTKSSQKVYAKLVGEENVVESPLVLGSEDFAEYGNIGKLVFGLVGTRNEAINANKEHHSSLFKIDEDSLDLQVAGYIGFTKDYFNI